MYREAIILNVFYKNIHNYNIYSKQCDIDIINELSLVALYIYIYICVFVKYVTGILKKANSKVKAVHITLNHEKGDVLPY